MTQVRIRGKTGWLGRGQEYTLVLSFIIWGCFPLYELALLSPYRDVLGMHVPKSSGFLVLVRACVYACRGIVGIY